MQIQDIMTRPVKTVRASATVAEAAELMALHDVGALPVCEGGRGMGILTDRDIVVRCVAAGLASAATEIRQVMSREPMVAAPSDSVEDAARWFTNLRIRRLPIVEDGRPVGMLSADDVVRYGGDDDAVLLMVRHLAPRRRIRTRAA